MAADILNLKIIVDSTEIDAAIKKVDALKASFTGLNQTISGLQGPLNQVFQSVNQMSGGFQNINASIAGLTPAINSVNAAIAQMTVNLNRASAAFNATPGAAAAATRGVNAHTGAMMNNTAVGEVFVLMHEAMSGRFSRMPVSLSILIQSFGGLGSAMAGVTLAMIVLGVAAYHQIKTNEELLSSMNNIQAGFDATGRSAQITTKEMLVYSNQLSHLSGISKNDVIKSQDDLSRHIDITADAVRRLSGKPLADLAAMLGVGIYDAEKKMVTAMTGGANAMLTFNKTLGVLTGDQIAQIITLEKLGHSYEAQTVFFDAYTKKADGAREKSITPLTRALDGLYASWDKLTGVVDKPDQMSMAYKAFAGFIIVINGVITGMNGIGEAMNKIKLPGWLGKIISGESLTLALKIVLLGPVPLLEKLFGMSEEAHKAGPGQEARGQIKGPVADAERARTAALGKTSEEQIQLKKEDEDRLEKYKDRIGLVDKIRLKQKEISDLEVAIGREKLRGNTAAVSLGNQEVTALKEELRQMQKKEDKRFETPSVITRLQDVGSSIDNEINGKIKLNEEEKIWLELGDKHSRVYDDLRAKGREAGKNYIDEAKSLALTDMVKRASLTGETELIKAKDKAAKSSKELTVEQRVEADVVEFSRTVYEKDNFVLGVLNTLLISQTGAQRTATQAMIDAITTHEKNVIAQFKEADATEKGNAELEKRRLILEHLAEVDKKQLDHMKNTAITYTMTANELERYNGKLAIQERYQSDMFKLRNDPVGQEKLNVQYEAQVKAFDKQRDSAEAVQHNFVAGWNKSFKQYIEDAKNAAKIGQEVFGVATSAMETMISNFIKTGKLDFKSFALSIIDEFIKIQAQQLTAKLFSFAFDTTSKTASEATAATAAGAIMGTAITAGGTAAALEMGSAITIAGSAVASEIAFASYASFAAKGNVYSGGNVVPFARGGIVTRPTIFPMVGGMGLMGEAGPEAVMPLQRNSSGILGVHARGAGTNIQNSSHYSITINSNQDADKIAKEVGQQIKIAQQVADSRIANARRVGGINNPVAVSAF